jgi:hypothetical protein
MPVGQSAGLRARQRYEFSDICRRHIVIDYQHIGVTVDLRHGDQILQGIIWQPLVQGAVDDDASGGHHADGVAIGTGLRDMVHGNVAAGAGHVLDDDRLAQGHAELIGQKPSHGIDARCESEQQPDIAIRIVRLGACRNRSTGEECRNHDKTN